MLGSEGRDSRIAERFVQAKDLEILSDHSEAQKCLVTRGLQRFARILGRLSQCSL